MNELAIKLNPDVQSHFWDIPCPNTPAQGTDNALEPHILEDVEWYNHRTRGGEALWINVLFFFKEICNEV
ncbi:hypothetical protein TNCV_4847551 [Trichonephila clavipes]|nr:hypothetical protein TNCV_4847551 [Trichonephila clavipes]